METDYAPRPRIGRGVLAAISLLPAALLVLTIVASRRANVPLAVFSRDPAATFAGHPLTGVQSHLGVLVWWAGASIALFAAALLRHARGDRASSAFLVWSGVISAVLTLDDLFQFHEDLAPRHLGLHDKIVVFAYGVAVLAYLVRFRRAILRSAYPLLLAGLVLFGGSNVVDLVLQGRWLSEWRIFVEDGFKLYGIVSWTAYLVVTSLTLTARPDVAGAGAVAG